MRNVSNHGRGIRPQCGLAGIGGKKRKLRRNGSKLQDYKTGRETARIARVYPANKDY